MPARSIAAQGHLDVSFSPATAIATPGGAEIELGVSQTTTGTATVTNCSHFPCTVYIRTLQNGITRPTGAVTSLDYCVTNCASAASWTAVPLAANASDLGSLLGSVSTNPGSVTFQLRYRLGWTGSPFSPPGSYLLPVQISLKN